MHTCSCLSCSPSLHTVHTLMGFLLLHTYPCAHMCGSARACVSSKVPWWPIHKHMRFIILHISSMCANACTHICACACLVRHCDALHKRTPAGSKSCARIHARLCLLKTMKSCIHIRTSYASSCFKYANKCAWVFMCMARQTLRWPAHTDKSILSTQTCMCMRLTCRFYDDLLTSTSAS